LEDFKDQYEFKIFGEEYLKFKHFIGMNLFIRLKINVRDGWTNRETGRVGEPRVQFLNFEMLQDVVNNNSKKLTLQLDIRTLEPTAIEKLKKKLKGFRGDKPLFFDVIDPEKSVKLTLSSRKQKVNISTELLNYLESNSWHYKLN
jgi:DNA polymerase-3 subunit alpha